MHRTLTPFWGVFLLQTNLAASANLRIRVAGEPEATGDASATENRDYMKVTPGSIEKKADKRHDLGIEKGKLLAKIYTNCTVTYNESKFMYSLEVEKRAALKIKESGDNAKRLNKQIAAATKQDNVKDPQTGESQKMKWMDQHDNEEAEVVFYKQILKNAEKVTGMAEDGHVDTDNLKKSINKEFDDLDDYQLKADKESDEAQEVLAEAKRLWKQWEDSTKDYSCGVPARVDNAKKQCDDGNTKFSIKCLVECLPGYDDPVDSKNLLRCRKEGKFGMQLYGEWKGFASCVGRMCGQPKPIEKSKTVLQKIRYPHSAHYHCYEGYSQDGEPEGAKGFAVPCDQTGNFAQNTSHVCKPVKCGAAPAAEGSEVVEGTFYFSDEVNYKCKKGHTLDETAGGLKEYTIHCQATGSFTQLQKCKRVRCGPAPSLDNTIQEQGEPGEEYFGDLTKYTCKPGYTLDQTPAGAKSFTVMCNDGGEFQPEGSTGDTPIPQCRPVSAGMLPEVQHGNAKRQEMFYGQEAIITADSGFSTSGNPGEGTRLVVTVSTEGEFVGIEKFIPVVCGTPPNVEKATTSFANGEGVFGDVLDYKCDDGYSTDKTDLDGAKSFAITCEADADFSKVPGLGSCANIDDCAGHSCGAHGDCVDHLKNYTCSCKSGYEQTWNEDTDELECGNIDDCGVEACGVGTCEDLVNGFNCHCPEGYEETGEDDSKTCTKKICGIPPEVAHTTTIPSDARDGKASYQDKIVYQCFAGYTLDATPTGKNHFEVDCLASTEFTATKSCKPVQCGEAADTDHSSKSPAKATFNESIKYSCEEGYTVDATPNGDKSFSRVCQANGKYSDASLCQPVHCGEPHEVTDAARPDGALAYGMSVTYNCFSGFTLDGKKDGKTSYKVKCHKDGSLDKTVPCLPKVCGQPHKHIHALHSSTKDEGKVAYPRLTEITCRDGYTIGGNSTGDTSFMVKCQESGDFDEYDNMECDPVRCGKLPELPNATLDRVSSPHHDDQLDKHNLNFEEVAHYKCAIGFSTGGEPSAPKSFKVECLPNGHFSVPSPDMQCRNINDCEKHTCGPEGVCIDLIGESPAYTCNCSFGHELVVKPNGEKSCGETDECKDVSCGVGTCEDLLGDYKCHCPAGYINDKVDGAKTCVPVQCEAETPTLENGEQTTSHSGEVVFPTTLQYKCNTGYSIDCSVADSKRHFQGQCKPNGQLDGMMACQKISCGSPIHLPFTNVISTASSILFEEHAEYECFEGYTIGGKVGGETKFTTDCPDSGHLTQPEVCEPVLCGSAPGIENGRATASGNIFYGMQLIYQCETGYSLDGTPGGTSIFERHCLKDGTFSALSDSHKCKPVHAGKAPEIPNADMTEYAGEPVTSFPPELYYPDGVEYRCKPGFSDNGRPSGATKITSRVNSLGKLDPALPSRCQPITFAIHGLVKDSRNGRGMSGSTVKVQGSTSGASTSGGMFTLNNVAPVNGQITLVYEGSGYIKVEKTFDLIADVNVGGDADTSMSPTLADDQWRAVIKWKARPADLDTYGFWGNTKTCWYQTWSRAYGMTVQLEKDDTNGFGPETLFFGNIGKCTASEEYCDIRYEINDYNHEGTMKDISDAAVTLYNGNSVAGQWKISDCQSTVRSGGNWWHVFTIDGKTNKLKWNCQQGPQESMMLLRRKGRNARKKSWTGSRSRPF
jgi:hypothetical protein